MLKSLEIGLRLTQAELGGASTAAFGGGRDRHAYGNSGGAGDEFLGAGVSSAAGEIGTDAIVTIAAIEIDARKELVALVAAFEIAFVHIEAGATVVRALGERGAETSRCVDDISRSRWQRLDGEMPDEKFRVALVADQLLECILGDPRA